MLTPVTMITIVNTFSASLMSGPFNSRNPTVVIVVIVMYVASMTDRPNAQNPIVPATKTLRTRAMASRSLPIVDLTGATVVGALGSAR